VHGVARSLALARLPLLLPLVREHCLHLRPRKTTVEPVNEIRARGACATPTCHDGVQNGEETNVDCGGVALAIPTRP
jgi:hypothetical protein